MQVGRVAVAVAVVGAVVSGCGTGPSQLGAAAIVGSDAVPLEQVQSQIQAALSRTEQVELFTSQGGKAADIARSVVTGAVLHDLLAHEAAEAGIVVTDDAVDAEIAANGGVDAILESSFYDADSLRQRVRDDLVAAKLAEQAVPGLVVTADLVAATSREDAEQKARLLAAGGPEAEALFTDERTAVRDNVYEAATQPDVASTVLFGTPVGGVVAFQPNPQQASWIVFRVTDRATGGPSSAEALSSISRAQLIAIGQRLMQPVAEEIGVRVNPRYGVWDPIRLRVVAEDEQSGFIIPSGQSPAS
jgi:hypothetical protein